MPLMGQLLTSTVATPGLASGGLRCEHPVNHTTATLQQWLPRHRSRGAHHRRCYNVITCMPVYIKRISAMHSSSAQSPERIRDLYARAAAYMSGKAFVMPPCIHQHRSCLNSMFFRYAPAAKIATSTLLENIYAPALHYWQRLCQL